MRAKCSPFNPRDRMTAPAPHRLRTLGASGLYADAAEVVSLLPPGKALALLAYLDAVGGKARRDDLIEKLWGNSASPGHGAHNLYQTLSYLRRELGKDALITRGGVIILGCSVVSDRARFRAAIERRDYLAATEIYRGDFLPNFAAPGGDGLERWIDGERQQLRAQFAHAACKSIDHLLASSRARDGVVLARRVRDQEPLAQAGWRLLIETLLSANDDAGAKLEAERLQLHLDQEDEDAEQATSALLASVRRMSTTIPKQLAGTLQVRDLVGRESEFYCLKRAWGEAKTGRFSHVHLEGVAGIGKTRLLDDFAVRLRETGSRCVRVRSVSAARDLAYGHLGELVAKLGALEGASGVSSTSASTLIALAPELASTFRGVVASPLGESEGMGRRATAFKELLQALQDEAPLALLLDDVHWVDPESLQVLEIVLDSLEVARVLAVTTSIPDSGANFGSSHARRLRLQPLERAALVALLHSFASLPDEAWATEFVNGLMQSTSGSPFLILEMLHHLLERDVLAREHGVWKIRNPIALLDALQRESIIELRLRDLTHVELEVLCKLALMGDGASPELLEESTAGVVRIRPLLASLERRGLVQIIGGEWRLAHEAVGGAALKVVGPARHAQLHALLGAALVAASQADRTLLTKAGRHLVAAGDSSTIQSVFSRLVNLHYQGGGRSTVRSLAQEFLGPQRTDDLVKTLCAGVPLRWRLGLVSVHRAVAAASMFAVVGIGYLVSAGLRAPIMPRAVSADHLLALYTRDSLGSSRVLIPVDLRTWSESEGIQPTHIASNARRIPRLVDASDPLAVGDSSWLVNAAVADTGAQEVFRVNPSGEVQRLTYSFGDDAASDVSPDRRFAVISTSRWNTNMRYDLGVLDLRTLDVRALTHDSESIDLGARFSPDGSRIVFTRRDWNSGTWRLCVVDFDGRGLDCGMTLSDHYRSIPGWIDPSTVLIAHGKDTASILRIDVDTWASQSVDRSLPRALSVSRDGRLYLCQCVRAGVAVGSWTVIPLARPGEARVLDMRSVAQSDAGFEWQSDSASFVDSIAIASTSTEAFVGVPHRLFATALTHAGSLTPLGRVRWFSEDTSVARIGESDGVLYPRRAGHVVIRASAGGWRQASMALQISPSSATPIYREVWDADALRAWWSFGTPRPRMSVRRDGRRVLSIEGDRSYESGVYSWEDFAPDGGLALDVELSAPRAQGDWQKVSAVLDVIPDPRKIRADEREVGRVFTHQSPRCGMTYPDGRGGETAAHTVVAAWNNGFALARVSQHAAKRAWQHVRIQLFPDGRCGFALNDSPVMITAAPQVRAGERVRIGLFGQSYATDVVVGSVTVTRGMPNGVDWSELETVREPVSNERKEEAIVNARSGTPHGAARPSTRQLSLESSGRVK